MEQGPPSSLFQVRDVTPMMDVPLPTSSCSLGQPFEAEPGLCAESSAADLVLLFSSVKGLLDSKDSAVLLPGPRPPAQYIQTSLHRSTNTSA